MKFPKQIFVHIESDGRDDEFLVAEDSDDPTGENGDKVAIYQLVEVKTIKRTIELV